jgi:trigger factor
MNIEREETGNLTATLKVKLSPGGLCTRRGEGLEGTTQERVLAGLPSGPSAHDHHQEEGGKAVLVNEVERLIDANLRYYLQDNAIRVLGQPLPKNETFTGQRLGRARRVQLRL